MGVAKRLMVVNLPVVDRTVLRLAPIDGTVGIERAFRMFRPVNEVVASGLHHFLIAPRIVDILPGIEQVVHTVVLDDGAGPDSLPVRSLRIGAARKRIGHLGPVQQVTTDDMRPVGPFEVENMVDAVPVIRNRIPAFVPSGRK